MKKLIGLLLIFLITSELSAQSTYSRVQIETDEARLVELLNLGIAADDGIYRKGSHLICELSDIELQKLDNAGFIYEILIEDVKKFYVERNQAYIDNPELLRAMKSPLDETWPVPEGWDYGSIGGFCSIDEMLDHLDTMIANYPDLISAKMTLDTTTIEGRTLTWVRISDNPNVNEDEPEVLYTGMHHAREPIGMQHLLFFMYHLLENYDSDPEVQYIVDNFELCFVPVINMDGYAYNIQEDPNGGGMWRKTRRDNGDGSFGVDPNRNYGFQWGYDNEGSSPYPGDETYRGTAPFTEPCVINMKRFTEANEFRVALNYHSHGNLLLYPFAYDYIPTPDEELFGVHSALMVRENNYENTPGYGLYVVNGGSDDWMYGEQETKEKILAYTPEVGNSNDGFWPSVARIIPLCQENMWQSMMAAKLSGAWATVRDMSPGIIEEPSGQFYFGIQRLGLENGATYTVSLIPHNDAIITYGDPVEYDNLELLEELGGSFEYTLKPDIEQGDQIVYVLAVDNGGFVTYDTISKVYGTPVVIFSDDGESLQKWSSAKWDVITGVFHSPEASITDSPNGEYSNFENNKITLVEPVNLETAMFATLDFWARWEIEAGYDYVQVEASANNGSTWIPLQGKYTHPGSQYQAEGEPVYDGFQNDWVFEEIPLTDFLGEEILIRFTLVSDTYVTEDGFYWDDMHVTIIDYATSVNDQDMEEIKLIASPNPAGNYVRLSFGSDVQFESARLLLFSMDGRKMDDVLIGKSERSIHLDLSLYEPGIYIYSLKSNGSAAINGKLVVR